MTFFTRLNSTITEKPIFAFAEDNTAPYSETLYANTITMDSQGMKTLAAGYFIGWFKDVLRPLPRNRLTQGSATNSNQIKLENFQPFLPGDALRMISPYATLTFSGSWAAIDTITLTVAGQSEAFTAQDTLAASIAINVANAINNGGILSSLVWAIAVGAVVYLFLINPASILPTVTVATSGAGVPTLSGAAFTSNSTPLGTIQAIDVSSGLITLAANAAIAVPVGIPIGVAPNRLLGLHNHVLSFPNYATSRDIAVYDSSPGVYEKALPWIDPTLKAMFPRITFAERF